MAGLYTTVDNRCGVWKSVNISVNAVIAPSVNISHEEQETLNDDAIEWEVY
jgi:phage tail sheath protein FI